MVVDKARRSRAGKRAYRRVLTFPPAEGKVVTKVELSTSPDDNTIEIVFQDKTALSFSLEPEVRVSPEFVSWKTGEYKPVRRWKPVKIAPAPAHPTRKIAANGK